MNKKAMKIMAFLFIAFYISAEFTHHQQVFRQNRILGKSVPNC